MVTRVIYVGAILWHDAHLSKVLPCVEINMATLSVPGLRKAEYEGHYRQ